VLVLGHKKLLNATTIKQMNISSSNISSI
jgi:hypothetical protein